MSTIAGKLVSGSVTRATNCVAASLVSLLVTPFVVHTLGDRQYGIWTLVATLVGYYGVLDLGLSPAISRYLARSLGAANSEECNRIFNTSIRIYLLLGSLILLLTGVIAWLAPLFCKNAEEASLFWKIILILGINLSIEFPAKVFRGLLESNLHFALTAALDLLTLGLRTVAVVVLLLLGCRVVALAWVTLIAGTPSILLSVYWARKHLPFLSLDSRYWHLDTAKTLFSYSAFSFVAQLAYIIRFRVDSVVVAAFVGLVAVTHYSLADRLEQYFMGIVIALLGVFTSVFSRLEGAQDLEALKRTFLFGSKLAVTIASFCAFGLLAWGKPFIIRWMGAPYADAYPVLVVLTIGLTFFLWQTTSISLLYGTSKHKPLALFNSIEALANLALSLVLVRRYGTLGVAVGTTIPLTINTLLVIPIYVCRVSKIHYSAYFATLTKTVGVCIASLAVPTLLSLKFAAPDYKSLFSVGILSAILYSLSLWRFEFRSKENSLLKQAVWPRLASFAIAVDLKPKTHRIL